MYCLEIAYRNFLRQQQQELQCVALFKVMVSQT